MGGINVYCGSFQGDDKSCSAFQGVLEGMDGMGSGPERSIIARIRADLLDEDRDHLLVEPAEARLLLPLLRRYAALVQSRLAIPGDFLDQMARDERAAPERAVDLKYGEGLGWQAWCVRDLLRAFETADAESEEVALVW
jgi:hypothetical protein